MVLEHRSLQMKSSEAWQIRWPSSRGAATAGPDIATRPQAPEAQWVISSFRVSLCLCCRLDTTLRVRPQGKISREKRKQYPWMLLKKCPNPMKYLAYRLCIAREKCRQTCPSPNSVYKGIWLFCTCSLSSYWKRWCTWSSDHTVVSPTRCRGKVHLFTSVGTVDTDKAWGYLQPHLFPLPSAQVFGHKKALCIFVFFFWK